MPAEVAASEPSATVIAWNWIIEELADCKEIETSILAAIVKRNRSGIQDPFYGDSARKRLALRCLEELADSTDVVSVETPANPLSHGMKVSDQETSILRDQTQKFVGLNIPSDFLNKCNRNDLRQLIRQRRDALPKSSLDRMKHKILKESDVSISKRLKSNTPEAYTQKCLSSMEKVQVREGSISGKPNDGDQNIAPDSTSDDEGFYDNEAPDLRPNGKSFFTETLRFLSSQNPLSDGYQTEQRSCIKCDEGGEVLMCTGSLCPIAIHPGCLGSNSSLNNPEDFKCPFCICLQAASEYDEARKKFFIAKKTLSGFLDKRVKPSNLGRETRFSEKPRNASKQAEASEQEGVNLLKSTEVDPAPSQNTKTDRIFPSSEVRDEEPQKQVDNGIKDNNNDSKEKDNGIKKKKDLEVNAGEIPSSSKYRKQRMMAGKPKRYANPIIPCGRRNRLPWTKEEETILKEAMQKFHQNEESKNSDISWIKIWEYGQHVFHRTRQPMDLKDKWRNIKLRRGQ